MDPVLLLKDRPGEKHSVHVGGLFKKTTAVTVPKGELLVPIPGDEIIARNDGQKPHNYRVKCNPTLTLYCLEEEVALLEQHEFLLLLAISSESTRLSMYYGHTLDWGRTLKVDDDVHVTLPDEESVQAFAKIRHVATDADLGTLFGVEIMDELYQGQGTCDGTFNGNKLFNCKEGCGLYVSLEKLSQLPPVRREKAQPGHLRTWHGRYAPTSRPSRGRSAQTTRARPRQLTTGSSSEQESDDTPQFVKGDRVVVYTKKGAAIHGMVRWTGTSTATQGFAVGIETDVPVKSVEFEYALPKMTNVVLSKNKRCQLFMPEGLVLPEGVSTVQILNPPRYGVIRWVGELPNTEGVIAGVELEKVIDGGCDGTWHQTGMKYFNCEDGKGMFIPLHSVKSVRRNTATRSSSLMKNPLDDVEHEVQEDAQIDPHPVQIGKYFGERTGIQGYQSSCYIDATVFGLFALSSAFDEVLLRQSDRPPCEEEIRRKLQKGIVNPLRMNGVVRYESVMAVCKKLEELCEMRGISCTEKDPQEFLNMLFNALNAEPFISIKRPFGIEKDFFVHLFVELTDQEQLPTVDSMLIKSFKEQNISFTEVPSRLLIQVPRYGTKVKTYQKILPALKLDVTDIADSLYDCYVCRNSAWYKCSECKDFQSKGDTHFCDSCCKLIHKPESGRSDHHIEKDTSHSGSTELELLSVICIETSHYVCFSRSEDQWVFFDSMAERANSAYYVPKGVDCTQELNEWVYCNDQQWLQSTPPQDIPQYARRFVEDVYICVYVQSKDGLIPDVSCQGSCPKPKSDGKGSVCHPQCTVQRYPCHCHFRPVERKQEPEENLIPKQQEMEQEIKHLQESLLQKEEEIQKLKENQHQLQLEKQPDASYDSSDPEPKSDERERQSKGNLIQKQQEMQQEIQHLQEKLLQKEQETHKLEESLRQLQQEKQLDVTCEGSSAEPKSDEWEREPEEDLSLKQWEMQQEMQHLQERLLQKEEETQKLEEKTQKLEENLSQLQQEKQLLLESEQSLTQVQKLKEKATQLYQYKDEISRLRAEVESLRSSPQIMSSQKIDFWNTPRQEIQIFDEIGKGGWGCVAKGSFRGKEVAVKWPHKLILNKRVLARLRREVQILAQIRHPNLLLFITAVFDDQVDQLEEPPLIVTELLDMDLRSAYDKGLLELSSKLVIFQDVACALNYLHQHHEPIIHRDVSAPNVLLEARHNNKWRAKLSDFGSANQAKLAQTAGEGAILYTPPEMFPTQAHSPDAVAPTQTTKVDVYSYGVLLCEVATNEMPEPGRYPSMLKQVKEQLPFIHRLIVSCTEKEPKERPTMADVLSQITILIDQQFNGQQT